jgi:competence protein ComEA
MSSIGCVLCLFHFPVFETLIWSTDMFKKVLLAVAIVAAAMGCAFAEVDVNKADQAALDGIKGVGPTTSKAILAERKKSGNFKDWEDFEKRVKGISARRSGRLSDAGLTVDGQPKSTMPAATQAAKKGDAKK